MFYKRLIRPILFRFDPEAVHKFVSVILESALAIPGIGSLTSSFFKVQHPSLKRELFGLQFDSPVGIAAGFDKHIRLYNAMGVLGFSHIEIGTVTPLGQPGNPKPRLFRIPNDKALINRMGFNNAGAEDAVRKLSRKKARIIIGGNIGKNTATSNSDAVQDYLDCFRMLFDSVDYFVVNVSCPNISDMTELQDRDKLQRILHAVMEENRSRPNPKPVLVKVSPDLNNSQLDDVIALVSEEGLSGVVATNTTITRDNLSLPVQKLSEIGNGGLSGQPLKDRATEVIRYIAQQSGKSFPIIGAGGIMNAADAMEKLDAGADLVQVYTGFIYEGPALARRINKEILTRTSYK